MGTLHIKQTTSNSYPHHQTHQTTTIKMRFSTIATAVIAAGVANAQVDSIISRVTSAVGGVPSDIGSVVSSITSDIGSGVASITSDAASGASSVASSIESDASSVLSSLASEASTATGSRASEIASATSAIASRASSAKSAASSAAASATGAADYNNVPPWVPSLVVSSPSLVSCKQLDLQGLPSTPDMKSLFRHFLSSASDISHELNTLRLL